MPEFSYVEHFIGYCKLVNQFVSIFTWLVFIPVLYLLLFESLSLFFDFRSVQLLSYVRLFATPWTAARQASLSITNSWSLLRFISIELVMPSINFILCHPLCLLPSIFPSIRVFSNEWTLLMRWRKYWNFNFSISPSKEHPGLISFFCFCFCLPFPSSFFFFNFFFLNFIYF